MKKRLVGILLCVFMVLSLFVGCSGTSDSKSESGEPVTLTFWDFHTGAEAEWFAGKAEEYNALQDEVNIEVSSVNQSDYTTTLITTAFASGECPDILFVEPATYNKYYDAGILAELTEYYSDELIADMLPTCINAATTDDGKYYTLPFECETLGLFYNIDTLEAAGIAPPTTWEEMTAAAAALTTDTTYGLAIPVEDTPYTLFNWWAFMWMNGADVYDDEGNVTVDTPAMAEALDFWGNFYQSGYSPNSLQIGPWDIDNIGTGVAAMQVGGSYMINYAEAWADEGVNIGVVPLPSPDGQTYYTVGGGQMMAVSSQSEYKDEAAAFIFWLFGDTEDITNSTQWCTEAKFAYPARFSVIDENEDIFQEGMKSDFTAFYDTTLSEPQFASEVTDIIGDMLQNVMFGGYTGADAAADAQAKIEALG